ncbi:MAG TPA: hypothetical protein PK725_15030, partial [Rhodocyclaceae bacterium]|nr:hypothetical protein [Rhodocyclaceae bacterium]
VRRRRKLCGLPCSSCVGQSPLDADMIVVLCMQDNPFETVPVIMGVLSRAAGPLPCAWNE